MDGIRQRPHQRGIHPVLDHHAHGVITGRLDMQDIGAMRGQRQNRCCTASFGKGFKLRIKRHFRRENERRLLRPPDNEAQPPAQIRNGAVNGPQPLEIGFILLVSAHMPDFRCGLKAMMQDY